MSSNPLQAHLQFVQSRHTKSKIAKELALFRCFRDIPYFVGYILSILVNKTKDEHTHWVLSHWQVFRLFFLVHLMPLKPAQITSENLLTEGHVHCCTTFYSAATFQLHGQIKSNCFVAEGFSPTDSLLRSPAGSK